MVAMHAIILSVGDELVLGQTVDTNSAWLSAKLAGVGCAVLAHGTVADDQQAIRRAIVTAVRECDVLLISGGLGPTDDDLTRQGLTEAMNVPLEENASWIEALAGFFRQRGRPMPERNRIQAMIPRGARMIFNHNGTAAGIAAEIPVKFDRTRPPRMCRVYVMPGVPKEMKLMFERDVLAELIAGSDGSVILSRTLHTFGMGESWVAEKLGALMDRSRNPSVGTTVSGGLVSLRLNARFANAAEARRRLDETDSACRDILGDLVFGADEQTLWGEVGRLLIESGKTVTTAESCTGGLLAKYLTDTPGSSAFFRQGVITYCNSAKSALLDVPVDSFASGGAVSEATARAMAIGALNRSGADLALAITGIAGPDGGTAEKPVGTVWIALASRQERGAEPVVRARRFNFLGDRDMIRDRAAKTGLMMLRYERLGKEME